MFKICILLLGFFMCFFQTGSAQIKESQVANVVNIRSDFNYKDPAQLQAYLAKKAEQEADKNNKDDEKLEEPADLFRVYLTRDRFYNSKNKYREDITFSVTSHNLERNYILDKDCPPYLEITDTAGNNITLNFKEMKFDNPYWISFSLTKKEIEQIKNIDKAKLVLPEAMENMFVENKNKGKMEKRKYDDDIQVQRLSYDIPAEIVQEWKQVLSADLKRK
ncbi:MAG TPA: hypothetical protein K8V65_00955 [Megamonas hypermegale]|uniref:DUF4384 domain-containing protein n=1 Tax=Megamonas hypermegale TaxID=158847 RepID=A0A921L6T3_9FIRM|nr:hypothetical protein [Megamonas hypermegale]MDM8144069.1 hypothetical protein [Megamonas hypermegale]HJF84224.1 hypothetical protein [Megamonas hypermegale]